MLLVLVRIEQDAEYYYKVLRIDLLINGKGAVAVERMKELSLFYAQATDDAWTYFDLLPLRKRLEAGKLSVGSEWLRRLLKGCDGLLIIPEATPGEHLP